MRELRELLKKAVKDFYDLDVEPELTRPDEQFGDYSSNLGMQLAPQLKSRPDEIAHALAANIKNDELIAKTEVAGSGFLNFYLTDKALLDSFHHQPAIYAGQTMVVEYSDPNPFKVLHVGHLYTSIVGDSVAKLLECAGAKVARVNFGGDVGLHVAKTMWSILQELGGELPQNLQNIEPSSRSGWLSERYIAGNNAYEDNPKAKTQIEELNQKIYLIHERNDHDSSLAQIYWATRQWSYEYFDKFYARIGSHFDKYYSESETVEPGLKAVKENIGKVFEESQGAIVFKGEVHNMHTRVFINSLGLPTYETKDIGLILRKWEDYRFDRSIIITGNEQAEYMAVVLAAVGQMEPELAKKTTHITHGMVKLSGGQKMSSRLGNIIKAEDVLEAANEANQKVNRQENLSVALGAVKYAFLKHRIGTDIVFNPEESVSIHGNSGPYLQYAYVRSKSILNKGPGEEEGGDSHSTQNPGSYVLELDERSLARKLSEFPEVLEEATYELMPHHICNFLYELAQNFNRFYESNRVIGDPREGIRLMLVRNYADVLKQGLDLLNIPVLEKM